MEPYQLLVLITSYLNGHTAIVRKLSEKPYSVAQLAELLNLLPESLNRRRKDPNLWRANELSQLAQHLGIHVNPDEQLRELNKQLNSMSLTQCRQLTKGSLISKDRFKGILKDSNKWSYSDLFQLKIALERKNHVLPG